MKWPFFSKGFRAPLAAFLAGFALAGCATAPQTVRHTTGPLRDADLVMAWSDPANRASSAFAESLVVRAKLDAGGEIYIRLVVSNIAGADGRAELRTRLTLADETTWTSKVRKSRGVWKYGKAGFDITVGDSQLAFQVGRGVIRLRLPELAADLTIGSPHPPLRPVGGSAEFGEGKFYASTVLVPRGRLRGTARIAAGGREIALAGPAYAEHRASNLAPYTMAVAFFSMIDIGPERTVLLNAFRRTAELGGQIQGWVYVATDAALAVYERDMTLAAQRTHLDVETGYEIPASLLLRSARGVGFTGAITAGEPDKRIDDLQNLGKVERFVVERLMKPFTFRYDAARYLFKWKARPGAPEEAFEGTARYQYQQLN